MDQLRDRKSWWESALGARPREGQFHFFQFVSLIMQIGKVGKRGKLGGPLHWQGREEKKDSFSTRKRKQQFSLKKAGGRAGRQIPAHLIKQLT